MACHEQLQERELDKEHLCASNACLESEIMALIVMLLLYAFVLTLLIFTRHGACLLLPRSVQAISNAENVLGRHSAVCALTWLFRQSTCNREPRASLPEQQHLR